MLGPKDSVVRERPALGPCGVRKEKIGAVNQTHNR